jgi:hypothetical protein
LYTVSSGDPWRKGERERRDTGRQTETRRESGHTHTPTQTRTERARHIESNYKGGKDPELGCVDGAGARNGAQFGDSAGQVRRLGEEPGVAVTSRVGAGVGESGVIICPAGAQLGEALEFVRGEPQGGGGGGDHGGGGGGLFDGGGGGGGGGGMMRKLLPGGGGLPSGGSLWRNLCDERRVLGDSLVISSCDERRGGEAPLISSSSSALIKLLSSSAKIWEFIP